MAVASPYGPIGHWDLRGADIFGRPNWKTQKDLGVEIKGTNVREKYRNVMNSADVFVFSPFKIGFHHASLDKSCTSFRLSSMYMIIGKKSNIQSQ